MLKFSYHNGHEQWIPKHRSELINNDDLEILDSYNAEIRGFYNYYSIANNASELNTFHYIMQYSMYKTFAEIPNHSKTNLPEIQTQRSLYSRVYGKKRQSKRTSLIQ